MRILIPFWGSRHGPVTGIFEHKNKPSVFLSSEYLFLSKKVPVLSRAGLLALEFVVKTFRILLQIRLGQTFF